MTDPKMPEKTDERIAAEKEAVQHMIGSKSAMLKVLDQLTRLECALYAMSAPATELARLTPPDATIQTNRNREGGYSDTRRNVTARGLADEIKHIAKMHEGN